MLRHALLTVVLIGIAVAAGASPIPLVNADFSNGLVGWTTFTTANGSLGPPPLPSTASFDVDGDGQASDAAWLQVGQVNFVNGVQEGGGLYQAFASSGGTLSLNAYIAALDSTPGNNAAFGLFQLLLDGFVVASFDFGQSIALTPQRATLNANVPVGAGNHEIRFLITRPFLHAGLGVTPYQYIDDVALDLQATPIPEPGTLLLMGVGLATLGRRLRRRRPTRLASLM